MIRRLEAPTLDQIRAARERIRGTAIRTPLLRLNAEGPAEIWLKCENLQPIGSFKLRGAGNALALAPTDSLASGVYTASAGNMAQGLAWCARRLGVSCTVVVPDHAPAAKLEAIRRLGGEIVKVPFDDWWRVLVEHRFEPLEGRAFVHPVSNPDVIAGNGTIALEILEDLPDVDAVLIPYGGGGLSTGIASGLRALAPRVTAWACEVVTAAPLSASLAAGEPRTVDYVPSFVDGIGAKGVLEEMWPLASALLAGSLVVAPEEAAAALRLMIERNRLVAEGAGAVPVAAALSWNPGGKPGREPGEVAKVVCVVSGGNIDAKKVAAILSGQAP
jgi:threonine dehydratase